MSDLTLDGYVIVNGDNGAAHRAAHLQAIADIADQDRVRANGTLAEREALDRRILDAFRVVRDVNGTNHVGFMGRSFFTDSPFWAVAPDGWRPGMTVAVGASRRALYVWNESGDNVLADIIGIAVDVTTQRTVGRNYGLMGVAAGSSRGNRFARFISFPVAGANMREPLELVEGDGNTDNCAVLIGPHGFFATSRAIAITSFELFADSFGIVWEAGHAWWQRLTTGLKTMLQGSE